MKQGLFIVVSAPSGAGKSTLCDRLMDQHPEMRYSISCTTRAPRGGEQDGVDYQFLDDESFTAKRAEGAFIEWAEVHGCFYGTPAEQIDEALTSGHSIIMDIDVQGAEQIRTQVVSGGAFERYRDAFVDIFITVPSMDELHRRLETRGEDSEDVISRRMSNALKEMEDIPLYRYTLVNDQLDEAYQKLVSIYQSEYARVNGVSHE